MDQVGTSTSQKITPHYSKYDDTHDGKVDKSDNGFQSIFSGAEQKLGTIAESLSKGDQAQGQSIMDKLKGKFDQQIGNKSYSYNTENESSKSDSDIEQKASSDMNNILTQIEAECKQEIEQTKTKDKAEEQPIQSDKDGQGNKVGTEITFNGHKFTLENGTLKTDDGKTIKGQDGIYKLDDGNYKIENNQLVKAESQPVKAKADQETKGEKAGTEITFNGHKFTLENGTLKTDDGQTIKSKNGVYKLKDGKYKIENNQLVKVETKQADQTQQGGVSNKAIGWAALADVGFNLFSNLMQVAVGSPFMMNFNSFPILSSVLSSNPSQKQGQVGAPAGTKEQEAQIKNTQYKSAGDVAKVLYEELHLDEIKGSDGKNYTEASFTKDLISANKNVFGTSGNVNQSHKNGVKISDLTLPKEIASKKDDIKKQLDIDGKFVA